MTVGNVGSASQLVISTRPITAKEQQLLSMAQAGKGTPVTAAPAATDPTTTAATAATAATTASLLAPPTDDQKAAAKAEDKQQEAFARMKVEMRAKDGLLS